MSSSTTSNYKRLEGKVAIVTGGAGGIGASTVHLFHQHGAKVVIADIQDKQGEEIARNLGGSDVLYVHCDVSEEDQVANLVDVTFSRYGQLDIMFNNAGVMNGTMDSILTAQKQDMERMLRVNLVGGFLGAKHAARAMVDSKKGGCILFTASCCTEIAGLASHAYSASKYGILGLSKTLAAELGANGIRVNCISPFGVMSRNADAAEKAAFEMVMGGAGNLKGKFLKAEDVAKAALFLASEEGEYVSGLNLVVDGGYSVVNPSLAQTLLALQPF